AHFTAYRSEFSTNSQKALYLAEKLTGHYRDWFSSHSIRNPGIFQNFDLFVSSLLSFSGDDKESSATSASCFAGLTQGIFGPPQPSLQTKPLIREVFKWNQKYLSSQTPPSSNLSPAAQLFVPDKVPLPSNPLSCTKPKSGGGFCLTAKEVLRRRNNNLCSYCGSKNHLLPACPLSKCSPYVNKTSTLTLLSLIDTSKSPTVLVTIHGPLGKINVYALLDTELMPTSLRRNLLN
ncbi:hypothetical protein DSO57_1034029, partial [Entomophthora muscae]